MKKRQYYIHSNVSQTQQLVDKLLLARISESNIHVVANKETSLGSLPKASPLQTSNIIHSIESGLVIGGITGLVASIAITLSLPVDNMLGAITLVSMLSGSLIGTWASSMVGSSTPNPNLKPYQSAIDEGKILLIVDVPASRADEIANIANNDHNAQHNWDVKSNEPDLELTMIV